MGRKRAGKFKHAGIFLHDPVKDQFFMEADYVIFTPSVGVLKWAVSLGNFFEPDLPTDKVAAIESLGFGSVAKIIMR